MTLKELFKQGKLHIGVSEIKQFSAVNIGFINKGKEDETQLDVTHNILTKYGQDELVELFEWFAKECKVPKDSVTYCEVVATANTYKELIEMGY